jgi:SNF2 family DNA or RNA helicase
MKFLLGNAAAAVLADPGLGKTCITLGACKVLLKSKVMHKTLIIAPVRPVYMVWPSELEKWLDFNGIRHEILHGPKKEEALWREADVYITNPESLEWLFGVTKDINFRWSRKAKKFLKSYYDSTLPDEEPFDLDAQVLNTVVEYEFDIQRIKELNFDTLVIDELTMFKNHKSKRHQILRKVVPMFARRWGLTGTPAPNGLEDLFGQMYLLDQGRALGSFITNYRKKYFDPTGFGGYTWVPKEGAEEQIYERLRPLAIRFDAKDHLDLPELVEIPVYVDLPTKAKRAYEEMERVLLTQISNGEVVSAMSAASASMKCRQIANGGVYRDLEHRVTAATRQERYEHLHDSKTEALVELVEELSGKPLLVAYDFEHDVDRLRKALPDAVFACDYTAKQFADIEKRFNAGEISVLCGHPASLGHGLNLQERGNHVAWYGMTWNLELYDQFNLRVCRQGNKHKQVFVHLIMARNTVDEVIWEALQTKGATQKRLLDALNTYSRRKKAA